VAIRASLDILEMGEVSYSCQEFNTRLSGCSLVTMPTEVFWLS